MPSVVLSKCCFFIPVRVGAFIVGYVISILKVFFFCILCIDLIGLYIAISQNPELVLAGTCSWFQIVMLYLSGMEMFMGIQFLVGLHRNKREDLKKFYSVYPYYLRFAVLTYLTSLVVLGKSYKKFDWLKLIPDLMIILFEFYGMSVVKSYYLDMIRSDTCWPNPNESVLYIAGPKKVKFSGRCQRSFFNFTKARKFLQENKSDLYQYTARKARYAISYT